MDTMQTWQVEGESLVELGVMNGNSHGECFVWLRSICIVRFATVRCLEEVPHIFSQIVV